jgi:protein tyrosine phosphatase (PTP) superfamily phosphohydrolase (DUF442 family)
LNAIFFKPGAGGISGTVKFQRMKKTVVLIIEIFIVVALIFLVMRCNMKQGNITVPESQETYQEEIPVANDPTEKFTRVDTNNVYFSGSIDEDDIKWLKLQGIYTVIRLNGDTKSDRGILSIEDEALLCSKNDMLFYYFNIEGDLSWYMEHISDMMNDGNVLVHCKNGAHRSPAMAAYYLRQKGIKRGYVIEAVGWEKLVRERGPYWKYVEPALK